MNRRCRRCNCRIMFRSDDQFWSTVPGCDSMVCWDCLTVEERVDAGMLDEADYVVVRVRHLAAVPSEVASDD